MFFTKRTLFAVAVVLFATICVQPYVAAQRCGVERWSVKTGTDADVARVDLGNPKNSTVGELVGLAPPHPIPVDRRFGPTEDTVFTVSAILTDYKMEGGSHGDSDYHLVLRDEQGNTMVAEIPSPDCVANGSPFAAQIANARAEFDAQLTATSSFQTANIPVTVTGVGFFDFAHGQRGSAPNVIELHPVLDIIFNPQINGGSDFSFSIAPSSINLPQGGSSSSIITVTTTGNGNAPVNITASGLPTGISSHLTSISAGKSALLLNASAAAPTGAFPITVTGTVGGRSHSQTATLNVSPFSSTPGSQQWEYQVITATSEQDAVDQANKLGAQDWEMVSVVKVTGSPGWRAFFKRLKRNF